MRPLALVVENDAGTRKLLDVLLSRYGCEVDVVANGLDALLLLQTLDYDLTILDLILPGASGADILEWMKNERPSALARTTVLSSVPPQHLQRVRDAYPPVRAVLKPFELDDIARAVERITRTEEREAMAPLDDFSRRSITAGAKSGVLVRANGDELSLVHKFGYRNAEVEKWFPLMCSADVPLCNCVREKRAEWIASVNKAASDYPSLVPVWRQNQSYALASVPLLRNGEVIGAAGWTFREPHLFDETEQHAFMTIAADAAVALGA